MKLISARKLVLNYNNFKVNSRNKIFTVWCNILFASIIFLPILEKWYSGMSLITPIIIIVIILGGTLAIFVNFRFYKSYIYSNHLLYFVFLGYATYVCIYYFSGFETIKRLGVFLVYYMVLIIFFEIIRRENDVECFLKKIVKCLYLYLFFANTVNHKYSITFDEIRYDRYWGINGINFHGYISSLTIILTIHLLLCKKIKKGIGRILICYSVFNLYMTGSRASIINVLVYLVVYFLFKNMKRKRLFQLLILVNSISIILITVIYYFMANPTVAAMFRFDSWGFWGRIRPLTNGLSIMKNNNFKPYGLGGAVINKVLDGMPLDNIYLSIGIEMGIVGMIVFLLYCGNIIIKNIKFIISLNLLTEKFKHLKIRVYSLTAIIVTILFNGIFENMLFNGFKLGTIVFLYCLSGLYYLKTYYNVAYRKYKQLNYMKQGVNDKNNIILKEL